MKCITCGQFGHAGLGCATIPTARKGQDNGGIRTLEDVRGRCVIEFDGDCWKWQGAFSSSGRSSARCPVSWSPAHGRVISVLRLVAELDGKPLLPRIMAWRACRNDDCCSPAHLKTGTRKQWGAWTAKFGFLKGDPLASSRNRKARVDSGDAVLTMELARWVRESTQTGKDMALALGVSATTVSRAKLRRTWAETLPSASVFGLAQDAWRGARA